MTKRTCPECGYQFTWHNNDFNKRVWEELKNPDNSYPMSLEDIDGVIRFHYDYKTRLIVYKVKSFNEGEMKSAQLKTLRLIEEAIDWQKFDDRSGVFLIKGLYDNTWNKIEISKLIGNNFQMQKTDVDFSYYHNWFYNKEIQKISEERYEIDPNGQLAREFNK